MEQIDLQKLSKTELIGLLKAYSRNWQTLDGLWFGNVEAAYGIEAAVRLDLRNWEKQAALEAARIKKVLNIGGGLASILKVLSLMSWQFTAPLFEIDSETPQQIVFHYSQCAVQEGRTRLGKPQFPCQQMKLTLLRGIAGVVEPAAGVSCLAAPPDPPSPGCWCRWQLSL